MLYYERVARNAITGADAFMPIQLRLSESKNHFLCMHANIASMVSSRHYRKRVFAVCNISNTWQTMCAYQKTHGKKPAHGKHTIYRVSDI